MKKNPSIVVILPAYNEEQDVEKLVDTWQSYRKEIEERFLLALQIAVINDGSKDDTLAICEQLAVKYDNFILVNHEQNKGLGEAVKTGFRYVVDQCPEAVYACLMDCDNTQHPKFCLDMLQKEKDEQQMWDVIIASRYQDGANVQGVAGYRQLTSKGAKLVYKMLLPIKGVRDYTCGYRLYKREILKKAFEQYKDAFIQESGFTCMAEIIFRLSRLQAKIAEVPFELYYNQKAGESKMKVLKTAKNSFRLTKRLRKEQRVF